MQIEQPRSRMESRLIRASADDAAEKGDVVVGERRTASSYIFVIG